MHRMSESMKSIFTGNTILMAALLGHEIEKTPATTLVEHGADTDR